MLLPFKFKSLIAYIFLTLNYFELTRFIINNNDKINYG